MVSLFTLWLPIVLSAVLAFVASFVIHMVLMSWHKNDYLKLPNEDKVMEALRPLAIPLGDYMMPRPASLQDMKSAEFIDKRTKGPVMIFTNLPTGPVSMGGNLVQWFIYCVIVGIFAAYVAASTLAVGTPYPQVFRVVGTTAFVGYALGLWQLSIWYRRAWGTTIRYTIDGLIYALLTAGTFGWLWPR